MKKSLITLKLPEEFKNKLKIEATKKGYTMAEYARLLSDDTKDLSLSFKKKDISVKKGFKIGF